MYTFYIDAVNTVDEVLIPVSWFFTFFFILSSIALKLQQQCVRRNHREFWKNFTSFDVQINSLLALVVILAFSAFYWKSGATTFAEALMLIWWRVFDGTMKRSCVLLFWLLCCGASLAFCVLVSITSTRRRKRNRSDIANNLIETISLSNGTACNHPSNSIIDNDEEVMRTDSAKSQMPKISSSASPQHYDNAHDYSNHACNDDMYYKIHHASTSQRKFFHLTTSLVVVSGLFYEPRLLLLASHILLQVFFILEALRALDVVPWAPFLNPYLLVFIDEAQESRRFVLTPILLFIGVFMPVLAGSFSVARFTRLRQLDFSGVQSVGVGDSFAALIGSWWANRQSASTTAFDQCNENLAQPVAPSLTTTALQKERVIKWTQFSRWANARKSLEGSAAMFFSQLAFMPLIHFVLMPAAIMSEGNIDAATFNWTALLISATISTVLEAHLNLADNLLLPLVTMLVYYVME